MVNLFNRNNKIEIQTIAYSLNFFLPTALLIFLSLNKNYELSAELGLIISLNYLLTQVFSSNARSLLISKNKVEDLIRKVICFRIILVTIIISVSVFIQIYFEFKYKIFLINISLIIIFQWLFELILLYCELKKNNRIFYIYIFISCLFSFCYLSSYYFYNEKSVYILLTYNLFLLWIIFTKIKNIISLNSFNKNIIKFSLNLLKSYSFLSSFSIQLTNLIWRILIIFFCGKTLAGIYFSAFAIGSLPSTIFNISFGPTIHKKKIVINKFFKNSLITYFIFSILFLIYYIYQNFKNEFNFEQFHFLVIFICMVSSYLMMKGTSDRQYCIQNIKNTSNVFKIDVIYSISILLIVPCLFILGGSLFVMFSFFIASLLSYLYFSIYLKKRLSK